MENHWSEEDTNGLVGLDLLVYQANLIGAEASLVLWGGGNTSLKVLSSDIRGRETKAMFIKGSGVNMELVQPRDFPAVYLEDVLHLFERTEMSDDAMVDYLARCLTDPSFPRPSIETLLHAFLPHAGVLHTHADTILSLTNNGRALEVIKEVFGNAVATVPYRRPGFLLSKEVALAALKNSSAKGAVLLNHGLVTWGSSAQSAYDIHIDLITQAEDFLQQQAIGKKIFGGLKQVPPELGVRRSVARALAPALRGFFASGSARKRLILRFDDGQDILDFVGSRRAGELVEAGAATPDHLLNTKRNALLVEVPNPLDIDQVRTALQEGILRYEQSYARWFRQHAEGEMEMLDPYPRVILVSGLGMWTTGYDIRAATITADIFHHTIAIMKGALGVDNYVSLSLKEAYEAEYWPLELYKLSLLSPERELSRRVALITGAARGIGLSVARRFASEGAHLVLTDVDIQGVEALAAQLNEEYGAGRCIAVCHDVSSEESTEAAFSAAVDAYGGLDILVSNAGIALTGALDQLELADWERSFKVNATGHFLAARQAVRLMREQGCGGSIVFVATKNVLAPGKEFGAYSAAKSAEVQLARVLAMENGAHGIRCNIINPDAVFQNSGLWSHQLRQERAQAHGIQESQLEEFYQRRNLLQVKVTPSDVASAVLFFASDRSAKTTGCILTVDGGVPEAFPR
ncbi:MAG: hypothetical protein BZY82_01155 [SAR202 cluster bacterium Io17-Chloro-G3]|nr:MAG: hypothetical protein BZY82_01155 [SAR202 cluster bacterium Io17-Chloro-G3]